MGTVFGTVVDAVAIAARIRRIVLVVPDLAMLSLPGGGDDAVGIYFPDPGTSSPPPMECRDGVWGYFDPDDMPEGRNYSVRHLDVGTRRMTCDFVLHERGIASDWARRARAGDRVVLAHARRWYRPEATTRWQLLVADLSGLPALARILEELPGGVDASVIVEVAEQSDLAYLPTRVDVPVTATVGTGNGYAPSRLAELVRAHPHPTGRGYCWFAGEARATREVRKHLRGQHGWVADQYDIVGYWRFDSETWDRKYEAVSDEVEAVYAQALADGKDEKIASEEYDLALERIGL
jgi:NADPH-dependent ferric siderophore reductase